MATDPYEAKLSDAVLSVVAKPETIRCGVRKASPGYSAATFVIMHENDQNTPTVHYECDHIVLSKDERTAAYAAYLINDGCTLNEVATRIGRTRSETSLMIDELVKGAYEAKRLYRTPDDVAAIMKQLMIDGGHTILAPTDPKVLSTDPALESQPLTMDK